MSHVQKVICQNYMMGFCPKGPKCEKEHIKSLIPDNMLSLGMLANFPAEYDW